MNSLRIAAAIALDASRQGLPITRYLTEEQARVEAIGRGMRKPRCTAITWGSLDRIVKIALTRLP